MAKRHNPLLAAMGRADLPQAETVAPPPQVSEPEPVRGKRPKSRDGKVFVAMYVNPEAHKQLRRWALDNHSSIQTALTEALNDFFHSKGLNRIA